MSARNGDKSRFHRLRKAKIRRRLRTEMLQALVTTQSEKSVAPSGEPAASEPAASKPTGERPTRGPLAAVAETLGSTIGNLVAKTSHPHKGAESSEKPAE